MGPGKGGGGRPGAGQRGRSLPCGRVPAGPADVAGRDPGLPRALGRPSGKSPGRPLPIPFLGGRGPERHDPCPLRVVRSHRRRKVPRKQLAWGRRSGGGAGGAAEGPAWVRACECVCVSVCRSVSTLMHTPTRPHARSAPWSRSELRGICSAQVSLESFPKCPKSGLGGRVLPARRSEGSRSF